MTDKAQFDSSPSMGEDPFEALLDDSSGEEFGLPEFRNHFSSDNSPVVLRDWTAKEFSSVYIRFKPHLERHAKRYLNNQTQVEEVVQDAFLYLMTALPELDSELGVLRFLKWKTRLLALDVIRLNSRVAVTSIEDEDLVSLEPEISKGLERADDAAIVSMALAKLSPRHREVLIASLYQEKTTEDISGELGLSENATRQLTFRARAAFKRALVGEAETSGLRISEILSIAARKARSDALTVVSSVGAIALIIGSFFAFSNWTQTPAQFADSQPPQNLSSSSEEPESTTNPGSIGGDVTAQVPPNPTDAVPIDTTDSKVPSSNPELTADATGAGVTNADKAPEVANPRVDEVIDLPAVNQPVGDPYSIEFGRASLSSIQVSEMSAANEVGKIDPVRIRMLDSDGRAISFLFDLNAEQIFSDVEVSLSFDGVLYTTLSLKQGEISANLEDGKFVFESKLGLLVDKSRNLLEEDSINGAAIRIQLDTDEDLTRIKMYEASYQPGVTTSKIT